MSQALLLLPDFLLILTGFVICRYTALDRPVWDAMERVVYYLLFPVLLFNSIIRNPLQIGTMASLVASGVAVVACGIALAWALGWLRGVDRVLHASGAQTAFRFNSYVGLALAERLGGAPGVAAIAMLIAFCVPLCNIAAVWPLARHGGQSYLRELVHNPLIVSTLGGLAGNLLGLHFPDAVGTTLNRIGAAALPLGLMAVGAGLRFGALREAPRLATAFLSIRHAVLPLLALGIVQWLQLPPLQQLVVVAFAALPTASTCYVLAARLGGNPGFVAGLVTLSTLLGMISVPVALWSLQQLQR